MSGTLCLAIRMTRLYKPVHLMAYERARPHGIWIGTADRFIHAPLHRQRLVLTFE